MSEPEKHHYLPIFYLNQWVGSDGKIVRYYRPYREIVASPIAPSNTGYEPALYRLEGYPPEFRNAVEKDYMAKVVDGPASEALRVLLAGDASRLVPELQIAWMRFLLSLFFRTPRMVKNIAEEAERNLRKSFEEKPEEYESLRTADHSPTLVEWVERNLPHLFTEAGKSFLPGIIDSTKLGNTILQMQWSVWTRHERMNAHDLLTSDSPIFTSGGLGNPDCVLALPISPAKAFFASRNVAKLKAVFSHGPANVARQLNASMVNQAERSVFASNDGHVRFVEKRLRAVARAR